MKPLFANPRRAARFSAAAYPLFLAALLAWDLLLRTLLCEPGAAADGRALLFTAGWLLLFGGLLALLPPRASRAVMLAVGLLFALLGAAHGVFHHVFGSFLSLRDLLYAGDGARFFSLSFLAVEPLIWVGAAALAALSAFCFRCVRRTRYRARRVPAGLVLLCAGAALLLFLNASMHYEEKTVTVGWNMGAVTEEDGGALTPDEADRLAYHDFNNPSLTFPLTGLYHYTFRDIYVVCRSLTGEGEDGARAALTAWRAANAERKNADNGHTGLFAGKNLILIMAESLDSWMIGRDATPNLCALRDEGIDFTNFYTPLWLTAGTFSTEFVSLTGVIPPQMVSSAQLYVQTDYRFSLPALFAAQGYVTGSFHPSNPEIYNRGNIHRAMGFEAYHNWQNMGMTHYLYDTEMLRGWRKMVSADKPFFSFIITISGHGPYGNDDAYGDIAKRHLARAQQIVRARGYTGSERDLYECACGLSQIMETDDFIGGLRSRLAAEGLLSDTVIVVYGDHYSKYLSDADFTMALKGVTEPDMLCNTPLFVWAEGLTPEKVGKYLSSADLFPTIANLFDLPVDLGWYVGDDAYGDGGGCVYWNDYSWCDGTWHESDGSAVSMEVRQKLALSRDTLKYDLFAAR